MLPLYFTSISHSIFSCFELMLIDLENVYFCRRFEDIFDVDHFIDYLKDDVQIVRDIPEWFTDKSELFTSIRLNFLVAPFSINT